MAKLQIYYHNENINIKRRNLIKIFNILDDLGYKWNSGTPLLSNDESIELFKNTVNRGYVTITIWEDYTITRSLDDSRSFTLNMDSNTPKEIVEAIKKIKYI